MNSSIPNAANNVPLQLGHYQLLDCIGRGGMGLVFRARDTRLERDVAIKCLRTELFEAHYIERFKREALLLARLNHPNIVQIYDFIETPDQIALVMELVDGQNLHTYLREHIVPISQRLQWLVQITEGLAIAHDAGIIHRDLKTENILINKRGQAKITDLGIAKSQDFNATLTDHVAGSYCSMSPEQAMGEAITFKSDLFSLGILAYQLLCGAHPFGDTNNKLQTMQRIISHPPTAPQKHNPDLPVEFIDLLGQLLSKDPDRRPDDTHWVAAQFAKLKELNWRDDALGDDTQALAIPLPTNTKATRTQDHPTFDTRFVAIPATAKVSVWKKVKDYVATNKIAVSSAAISLFIIAGIVVWQLQPKPPKYVAVIPPKLTAEGMQESQQELVREAVYNAIQQSVIQLENFYLVPQNEIAEISGDNESIRLATASDEIITTEIRCKNESCNINLSRLAPKNKDTDHRLGVLKTKAIDILTDNYLSVSETVQTTIENLYSIKIPDTFEATNANEYTIILNESKKFRTKGASNQILETLDKLSIASKKLAIAELLYREVSLDLYYETQNTDFLEKLDNYINLTPKSNDLFRLYTIHNLLIAKLDIEKANRTVQEIKKFNPAESTVNELYANIMMAKNDYKSATIYYKKSLESKPTANNFYNLANAYWYFGSQIDAKNSLQESLKLAPNYYKSLALIGLIALAEGDIDLAINSLEKVNQLKENDLTTLNNLGLSYLLSGDLNKAEFIFDKALHNAPHNTTFLLNMADTKELGGKTEEARVLYQNLITRLQTESDTNLKLRNIAQAYAHLGFLSEALKALEQLEKIDHQNMETSYTATLVHSLANNRAAAIFEAEKTLDAGMHPIWFRFAWFDKLCEESQFISALKKYGEHRRCPP